MYRFEVIDNENSWTNIVSHFNNPDCYYSYTYGEQFAKIEIGSLYAAYYEDNEGKIFYPFIRRKVPHMVDLYDIVTPYGYGGPLIEAGDRSIERFYEEFGTYCEVQGIITETIRFHPIYANHKPFQNVMHVDYIRKTTAVDLKKSLETIREQYSSMNKRNIKKAKKHGVSCYVTENNKENLKIFMNLYKETMDRSQAASYYYFNEDYFINQLHETDLSETFLLFAKKDQEIIAGVMVLVGKDFSHYHLGASRTKYLEFKPNNLLFDYMIEFCHQKGSKFLHLGGGYSEDDGLFKFKSSFTNQNNFDYFLGKKIHNQYLYNKTIEHLTENYYLDQHYFPIYRGDLKRKMVHLTE